MSDTDIQSETDIQIQGNYGLSLFIKRIEMHHTPEFIMLQFVDYGKISNIRFIPKQAFDGTPYKAAIVTFRYWFMTQTVHDLFINMAQSDKDGTTKFNFIEPSGRKRYWYVKEYSPLFVDYDISMTQVYATNNTQEQIEQMNDVIKSMAAQLLYYKERNATLEKKMEQIDREDTVLRLQMDDFGYKAEQADRDRYYVEQMMNLVQLDLLYEKAQNEELRKENEELVRDIKDREKIIDYYEKGSA